MIKIAKDNTESILTDEEIEFLAIAYVKLKKHPQFKKFSSKFQDFVNEYLERELKGYLNTTDRKKLTYEV